MYKCGICGTPSKPREPLIRLVVPKRDNPKQIAREVPVCRVCAKQLQAGASQGDIVRSITPAPPADVPTVAAPTTKRAI